jgi:uncharacterized protein YkwD
MKHHAALAMLPVALAAAALTLAAVAGASAPSCSARVGLNASSTAQERAMLCLTNRARRARGLAEIAVSSTLDSAADHKSADILRCDEFSHEACGRPFAYWMDRLGFRACAEAENIAWGTGRLGSVHSIFRAWMHSSGHRENILGPYDEIGIGLRMGRLDRYGGAHVWTQDFGARC